MKTIVLKTKPIPINQKYFVVNGRMILSKKYRDTKEAMQWEITSQVKFERITEDVALNILFYYGDKRKRDIDAYLKILLDSMSGIVYVDDSQITLLHVSKFIDKINPRTVIQILNEKDTRNLEKNYWVSNLPSE
jgi:crossover junction endodeoxyribonuclease RusA